METLGTIDRPSEPFSNAKKSKAIPVRRQKFACSMKILPCSNSHPGAISLSTGKKQGNFMKSGSYREELPRIRVQFHNVTSKFPVNWNRE